MLVIVPIILCAMLTGSCAHATVTLQANGATPATTFSLNNVSAHIADSNEVSSLLYVGRHDATIAPGFNDAVAQYALSEARQGVTTMIPAAPETVRLNNVADQLNPLFGQQIALVGLYTGSYGARTPFAVTTANPQSITWNISTPGLNPFDVLTTVNPVTDATGATTAGIVAVAGASILEQTSAIQIRDNFIFSAVCPNGGVFGPVGSGIALVGQDGATLVQFPAVAGSSTVQAVPLDGTQTYVQSGPDAAVITAGSVPDVYFDAVTQRVYCAITVSSGAGVTDGARGVVMGYYNPITTNGVLQKVLTLTNFAPAAAYTGTTEVGGVVGAGVTATMLKFRSLYTSTGLTYGVLVGSNGATAANQTVSAVPLVNKSVNPSNTTWPTDPTQGALASKIINPGVNLQTFFNPNFPLVYPYAGRGFQVPAATTADLPLFTDAAVAVGAGVTPGTINDIQVSKDAVYVAVNAGAADAAGVFVSQALFDGNAAIKGWTPWQRAATPTQTGNTIYGIGYQPSAGKLFTMEGGTAATIDAILTTTWANHDEDGLLGGTTTNAQVGFIDLVNSQFSQGLGGIQAAFDFPHNTVGFAAAAPNRLSAMIFTGYQRVVLAQTGADTAGGIFTPNVGDYSTNMQISNNGAVTTPGAGALIISVTGGALNTLGALTSAVIVSDGVAANYLVVGGVGGIAVLQPGWPLAGLQKNFQNLPASAFTLIGSYKNVRKLLSDGTNLYVLTNQTFDRIPAAQLAGTAITPVTIATPTTMGMQPYGQFSDVVVSAKVGILATSQGIFYNGAGTDVSAAPNAGALSWTALVLPESQTAITRLQPLSPTGLPQDFSKNPAGGMVYVLAGSVNYNLASIYRVAVASTQATAVTSTTVQAIPDYFVQGTTSALAALGAYRNYTTNFGALITASESSYDGAPPVFEALPSAVRTGVLFPPKRNVQIQADISSAQSIGNLIRNTGVGPLILPTNIGMRTLE